MWILIAIGLLIVASVMMYRFDVKCKKWNNERWNELDEHDNKMKEFYKKWERDVE